MIYYKIINKTTVSRQAVRSHMDLPSLVEEVLNFIPQLVLLLHPSHYTLDVFHRATSVPSVRRYSTGRHDTVGDDDWRTPQFIVVFTLWAHLELILGDALC